MPTKCLTTFPFIFFAYFAGFVTRQQTQLRKTSNSLLTIKFLETLFGANKLRAIIQTTNRKEQIPKKKTLCTLKQLFSRPPLCIDIL